MSDVDELLAALRAAGDALAEAGAALPRGSAQRLAATEAAAAAWRAVATVSARTGRG